MEDCALCNAKKRSYQFVTENEHAYCLLVYEPIKKGHFMVLPTRHVTNLGDLNKEESAGMMHLLEKVRKVLKERFGGNVLIGLNAGDFASQAHLHFHILPCEGGVRDYFTSYEGTPLRTLAPKEKLQKIVDEFSKYF